MIVAMANRERRRVGAKAVKVNDVLVLGGERYLVVSTEYPAGTVPMPEAKCYCEPGLVLLARHRTRVAWSQTHQFTYALLEVGKRHTVWRTV